VTAPERRALLATLVARTATPGSRTLLAGEPGAGRTHLLGLAVRGAREAGVVVLDAAAAGAGGPFAGLAALLRTVPGRHLAALPAEQRAALDADLTGPVVDPTALLALRDAVTAVLAALLVEFPVCLAVDDWPLLDRESATVVRRLLDRSPDGGPAVSLLATQRLAEVLTGVPDRVDATLFHTTDVLPVPALSVGSLAAVLAVTTGQRWSGAAVAGLHAATGGNPRWATELAGPQLAHSPGHVGPQLPASVAGVLGARVDALSDRARAALTVVAALGGADPACVLAALPDPQVALVEARDAGVLHWSEGHLEPVHPVLGTAALARLGHRRVEELRRTLYGHLGRQPGPV
jgi:hypothetical protein